MCVCPAGQEFDYSSGSCQSEDEPLLCNCNKGIANCMWMSADLGFYCGCKDGGRDTQTYTSHVPLYSSQKYTVKVDALRVSNLSNG